MEIQIEIEVQIEIVEMKMDTKVLEEGQRKIVQPKVSKEN